MTYLLRLLGHRRLRCLWLGSLWLLPALSVAQPSQIDAMRAWSDASHTRLVFDLSGPLDYHLEPRAGVIALLLHGGALGEGFHALPAQGLYRGFASTRHGQDTQILVSSQRGARASSFVLQPDGQHGYRLVLDLLPGVADAADPPDTVAAHSTRAPEAAPTPAPSRGRRAAADAQPTATWDEDAGHAEVGRKLLVVVDPGHGGKDPGSHGPDGVLEKNVTLAIGTDLAAAINRQPGMRAALTRDDDTFVPLQDRYGIARRQHADMFVSIHADSAPDGADARGASVWVLSLRGKTSQAGKILADRENNADLVGGVSLREQSEDIASLLLDMQQDYVIQASETIADNVLHALGELGPTHRGHIERANFVVLHSPDVPSILVETAFISNRQEERKLADTKQQKAIAAAVLGGIVSYFKDTPPPGSWFAAHAGHRADVQTTASGPSRQRAGAG
ncbi:MAG: N-acetylmuramoyl-L-alanine amidase [Dyella sp.]